MTLGTGLYCEPRKLDIGERAKLFDIMADRESLSARKERMRTMALGVGKCMGLVSAFADKDGFDEKPGRWQLLMTDSELLWLD
ncbi:hypothetical protein KFK09_018937 [Dendrobium nobile]|uniref:Uncharacterized protein n=1 Tax=Dendrobium nobile TaxID=94219 RepID=A0A8T3AX88_DENNO|nr:hypothetical protein KFK09_018937 [Dendrobium nobile]